MIVGLPWSSLVLVARSACWRRALVRVAPPGPRHDRAGRPRPPRRAPWSSSCCRVLTVGALVAERGGAPFWLQQVLAWPGYLWLAAARSTWCWRCWWASSYGRCCAGSWSGAGRPRHPDRRPDRSVRPEPYRRGHPRAPKPPRGPPAPRRSGHHRGRSGPAGRRPRRTSRAPRSPRVSVAAPSRRLFVSRVVGGAAAAAAVGTVGYGTYGVLRGPRVKRVTVPLAKLPRARPRLPDRRRQRHPPRARPRPGHAQQVVDTINSTQPDLVAVVGDLVDGTVDRPRPGGGAARRSCGRGTARSSSPATTSTSPAPSEWVDHVRRARPAPAGERPRRAPRLRPRRGQRHRGRERGPGPRLRQGARRPGHLTGRACCSPTSRSRSTTPSSTASTSSSPATPTAASSGPATTSPSSPTRPSPGLERYGDTQLYVTRGAGAWGPPVRVGAPSDITVVELASPQA